MTMLIVGECFQLKRNAHNKFARLCQHRLHCLLRVILSSGIHPWEYIDVGFLTIYCIYWITSLMDAQSMQILLLPAGCECQEVVVNVFYLASCHNVCCCCVIQDVSIFSHKARYCSPGCFRTIRSVTTYHAPHQANNRTVRWYCCECCNAVDNCSHSYCTDAPRLYQVETIRIDRNQPHVLKYSAEDNAKHTGVELHHDKCDLTASIMLSRSSSYDGGG